MEVRKDSKFPVHLALGGGRIFNCANGQPMKSNCCKLSLVSSNSLGVGGDVERKIGGSTLSLCFCLL